MIIPTKYMNLETCVLRVAALILDVLGDSYAISLSELSELVRLRPWRRCPV